MLNVQDLLIKYKIPKEYREQIVLTNNYVERFWAIEKNEVKNTTRVLLSYSPTGLYDGKDETLSKLFETKSDLVFRNKDIDKTLIFEEFKTVIGTGKSIYILHILDDSRMRYEA